MDSVTRGDDDHPRKYLRATLAEVDHRSEPTLELEFSGVLTLEISRAGHAYAYPVQCSKINLSAHFIEELVPSDLSLQNEPTQLPTRDQQAQDSTQQPQRLPQSQQDDSATDTEQPNDSLQCTPHVETSQEQLQLSEQPQISQPVQQSYEAQRVPSPDEARQAQESETAQQVQQPNGHERDQRSVMGPQVQQRDEMQHDQQSEEPHQDRQPEQAQQANRPEELQQDQQPEDPQQAKQSEEPQHDKQPAEIQQAEQSEEKRQDLQADETLQVQQAVDVQQDQQRENFQQCEQSEDPQQDEQQGEPQQYEQREGPQQAKQPEEPQHDKHLEEIQQHQEPKENQEPKEPDETQQHEQPDGTQQYKKPEVTSASPSPTLHALQIDRLHPPTAIVSTDADGDSGETAYPKSTYEAIYLSAFEPYPKPSGRQRDMPSYNPTGIEDHPIWGPLSTRNAAWNHESRVIEGHLDVKLDEDDKRDNATHRSTQEDELFRLIVGSKPSEVNKLDNTNGLGDSASDARSFEQAKTKSKPKKQLVVLTEEEVYIKRCRAAGFEDEEDLKGAVAQLRHLGFLK